jgi:hypothetical protein
MANIKEHILEQTDILLDYLDGLKTKDSVPFTEQEVQDILATERDAAQKNYNNAIAAFLESNNQAIAPKVKRFAVYWGYPGAGKSVMTQKLIERFSRDEDCLPFNIIDKDNHRDLFPHLFDHLKGGHIDECERFAGVTIDYVRTILDLSLKAGQRSVLSIGSMGAGVEFKDNAQKAISHGYKPCAVYMAVNKDIAYLSNIYRSANLYDQIIFQNKQLYPRLVSSEYFERVVQMLPKMIENIDAFQKENAQNVDLMVLNRDNALLYDSRKPHEVSVKDVIIKEENRMLTPQEVTTLNMQLYKIKQNMKYRYDNNVYTPCKSEVTAAKIAVSNVHKLIEERYDGRISGGIMPLTPMMRFASEFGKAI